MARPVKPVRSMNLAAPPSDASIRATLRCTIWSICAFSWAMLAPGLSRPSEPEYSFPRSSSLFCAALNANGTQSCMLRFG